MMKKIRTAGAAAAALLAVYMLSGCADAIKDGTKALKEGRYEEAQELFQEAAGDADDKTAAEAYRGLGMAYYEQEEYTSALEAFQTALDKGGEQTVQIYNLMGICGMKTSDYGSALGYFQSGLAMADTSAGEDTDAGLIQEMRYNEIVCYEQTADWESAKQKISEYLADYPGDETAEKEAEFLETR